MSQPGWYPDPAGSGGLRYWDGQRWVGDARKIEHDQDRVEPVPPGRRRAPAWVVAVTILVALIVIGIIGWLSWPRERPVETASPTISGWDETSGPTSAPPTTPSPQPSTSQVACPLVTGTASGLSTSTQIEGGGLSFARPEGWRQSTSRVSTTLSQTGTVTIPFPATTWVSYMEVGYGPEFTDAESASRQVIECHVTSDSFPGFVDYQVQGVEQIDVDGHPAWLTRMHAATADAPGGGASFVGVAIEVGDDPIRVFVAGAVDGDDALPAVIEETIKSLKVEA